MIDEKIIEKIKPGAMVQVTERIREKDKERSSNFKGMVIARKHGSQQGATFTVRSVVGGVGVEKIYPIFSPKISAVKVLSTPKKVKRSKLYWIRTVSKKKMQRKLGASV